MTQVFSLFEFQQEAADELAEAAHAWVNACASEGPLKHGRMIVPFLGQLRAVTGAGKTPILARTCAQLGPAIVLWTSRASAVVEQTYRNLLGKYRSLLPTTGLQVVRERPSKSDWERLITATRGLSIWTTTVASWNEAEAAAAGGSDTARLNMHRPHPDWGGRLSPWEQLRTKVARPIWVVYDESHNQTPTQLDQLVGLAPVGFLMASATPPSSELFSAFDSIVRDDTLLGPIAGKGRVVVSTRDVVDAGLLKQTVEVRDYQSEPEPMLEEVIQRLRKLDRLIANNSAPINPKAIYVVEESNPKRGSKEMARPVAIWHYLRSKKVRAADIALYTQTRDVPDGAEKISALSELRPGHRHIIFNRALQEGWDDPEAYLCYFDGVTKSYVRIQQIVGRVLRQPYGHLVNNELLNTATLFIRVPTEKYEQIINAIKRDLSIYALDSEDPFGSQPIRVRSRREPLPPVRVRSQWRAKLKLPTYVLGEADLRNEIKRIEARGRSPWAEEDLLAPGLRRSRSISLRGNEDQVRFAEMAMNARIANGEFLRRRIRGLSRSCLHLLHPDHFAGPAYTQRSCPQSPSHLDLAALASAVVESYESSVQFQTNPIASERMWHLGEHLPSGVEMIPFRHSAHARYARLQFNKDELDFAQALDSLGKGVWARNPSSGNGYSLPLPVKAGDSSRFFPDFLWWVRRQCLALDTTGRHILEEKVRAKLLTIDRPRIVLITRGKIARDWTRTEEKEGWTMVRQRIGRPPSPEHFETLSWLVERLHQSL